MRPSRSLLLSLALTGVAGAAAAQDLPQLALDPAATTVSGLSSGAFMAVQMHVAFSDRIAGAGVVAGGPYYCAQGSLLLALNDCMETDPEGPEVAPLLDAARSNATAGTIAPLTGLAGDRVYLFSGTNDRTVEPPSVKAAETFYREAGVDAADLFAVEDIPAGHGFLAPNGPIPCAETGTPFINDCGVDQAGDILEWLYGALNPPVDPVAASFLSFSQTAFVADTASEGLDDTGFAYVPKACSDGATCRLHIAFHGCKQGRGLLGDRYARTTGYNGWAEANNIVVLYPQAVVSAALGNPNGCWDWWGYGDEDYATRNGPQMAAVAQMAARLGVTLDNHAEGETCISHDEFNVSHWRAGRIASCGLFSFCAVGSGDGVGPLWGASTLYETRPDYFSTIECH